MLFLCVLIVDSAAVRKVENNKNVATPKLQKIYCVHDGYISQFLYDYRYRGGIFWGYNSRYNTFNSALSLSFSACR